MPHDRTSARPIAMSPSVISCRERMHEYGQCRGSTSASVVERWRYAAGEALLLGAGPLSLAAMEVMALWYRRRR